MLTSLKISPAHHRMRLNRQNCVATSKLSLQAHLSTETLKQRDQEKEYWGGAKNKLHTALLRNV